MFSLLYAKSCVTIVMLPENEKGDSIMNKFLKNACTVFLTAIMIFSVQVDVIANQSLTSSQAVRAFFEKEGAAIEWNGSLSQIIISLGGHEIRLYIDSEKAYINNSCFALNDAVVLKNGISFISYEDADMILALLLHSITPVIDAYGVIAYRYLEFMEENLPYRFPFTQRERETAEWIAEELLSMGHCYENIRIQRFPMSRSTLIDISVLKGPLEQIPPELQSVLEGLLVFDIEDLELLEFVEYSQNVILTVPGASERRIIVGAHYDSPNNKGVSDNASGVVLLLESAERILHTDNYYTITYIFFGAEELGLIGSLYYFDSLSESELEDIVLMINVDILFDGTVLTYSVGYHDFDTNSEGSSDITRVIEYIANALNDEFDFELVRQPEGVYMTTDHLPFLFAGMDVLVFYSMDGFLPSPIMAEIAVGNMPELTAERLKLIIAMLDGDYEYDIASAIESDRGILELFLSAISEITLEVLKEQAAMLEQLIASSNDIHLISSAASNLERIGKLIAILEHPDLESFEPVFPVQYAYSGLVLHTENDSIAYLNENFPGLIQTALEAYSIFLERVLLMPAGSLG